MGLFRYLVQGFGWEIGATAAREGIEAVKNRRDDEDDDEQAALPPTKRELAAVEKEKRKADADRIKAVERKKAEIEAELARLKKQK
jgi:hypothetical protein